MGDVSWFVAPLLTKTLSLANLPQELHVKFPDLSEGVIFGLAFELNKRIVYKFSGEFPEALPLLSEWEKRKTKSILSEEEAHKKTLAAESWYLDWKRQNEQAQVSEAVAKASQTVSLPLLDAMGKYQRLSEQTVTEGRIVVKGESQPVRGSIRNWVRHYRDVVGIRKHSAMERGQFLFQGENTKRLGAPERERLSVLFRSLDENMPLSIDVERQEVLFPATEASASAPGVHGDAEASTAIGTSFRPYEKFPASAAPLKKALEWEKKEEKKDQKSAPLFGQAPESPRPEVAKPGIFGASAPVYSDAPETPSVPPVPATPGTMSFSSSHVLPHEKEKIKSAEHINRPPAPSAPPRPEAISVIKPRGNHFGFRSGDEGGSGA